MLTNNEKVAFYGCILKNLVHSAIQSLGNGRTELEGADICLPNGAVSTKDISLYFPVPIVLATNRHIGKRKKLREDLFSLLQAEEHRTSEYTKVVTPYLWSVYGDRNAYRLDKKGFEKVDFEKVFKEAGETGLVDLQVDSQTIPVLIHNVQTDYLGNYLHADFYKVNLSEKVKTMVPILIVGEPKAVVDKVGLLMNILSEVEVEALPEQLPEHIEVNVENLALVDEQITAVDIKAPEGVAILTDPNQVIVKIGALVSKEAEELVAQEAASAEEAKAEGAAPVEGAEGEASAEETKPEEGKKDLHAGKAGETAEPKPEEK